MLTALCVKIRCSEQIKSTQMNKLIYLILTLFTTVMVGCTPDNDDSLITSSQLSQTIWEGKTTSYDSEGNPGATTRFILEFLSETEGKCILQQFHEIKTFQYSINDSIVSFKGGYVEGDWFITESSKDQIILLCYKSTKMVMTLNRTY